MSTTGLPDPAAGLGQIQAADPTFDVAAFMSESAGTFLSVKHAIDSEELAPVVDLLTDRVYDDLRLDLESRQSRGAVPQSAAISPTGITVVAADHGAEGDAITLRIQARAATNLGPAQNSGPPNALGQFTEFWTFTRAPISSGGSGARFECPNCGAPIDIDTGQICRYCKALLPSRAHNAGWVVAAIRPAQENLG